MRKLLMLGLAYLAFRGGREVSKHPAASRSRLTELLTALAAPRWLRPLLLLRALKPTSRSVSAPGPNRPH